MKLFQNIIGMAVLAIFTACAFADPNPPVVVNNYNNITMPPPAVINNNSQPNNNNAMPQYSAPQTVVPQQYGALAPQQGAYGYHRYHQLATEAPLPYPIPTSQLPRYYAPQARPFHHSAVSPQAAPTHGDDASAVPADTYGRPASQQPQYVAPQDDGEQQEPTHPVAPPPVGGDQPQSTPQTYPLAQLPQHPEQTPGIQWGPTTVQPVDSAGNPTGPARVITPGPTPVASTATHKEWAISEDPNAPGPVQVDVPN